MKIYKTLISFTDTRPGEILMFDTIEWNGKFWIVPEWLDNHAIKKTKPIRIICLDELPHQKNPSGKRYDFALTQSIPSCVLDGEIPKETSLKFEIVESPDIQFDILGVKKFH